MGSLLTYVSLHLRHFEPTTLVFRRELNIGYQKKRFLRCLATLVQSARLRDNVKPLKRLLDF